MKSESRRRPHCLCFTGIQTFFCYGAQKLDHREEWPPIIFKCTLWVDASVKREWMTCWWVLQSMQATTGVKSQAASGKEQSWGGMRRWRGPDECSTSSQVEYVENNTVCCCFNPALKCSHFFRAIKAKSLSSPFSQLVVSPPAAQIQQPGQSCPLQLPLEAPLSGALQRALKG